MAASQAATVSTRGSTRPSTGAWPSICVAACEDGYNAAQQTCAARLSIQESAEH